MKVHQVRIKYRSRKAVYRLHPIGDVHAGTVFCAEEALRSRIQEIKEDPFALWIGMGDYAECIIPSDRRWDVGVISKWVDETNIAESQRERVVALFGPIKEKCIGLLTGNHEESIRIANSQNIHLDICRDLKVENLGYSCFIRLFFERSRAGSRSVTAIDCRFEHGSGSAQTEGGKIMRLTKGMAGFDADIYGMAHLHDIKTNTITMLYLTEGFEIKRKVKVGAITGCWFRPYIESDYPSYAEKKGYTPTNLGAPIYTIKPDKRLLSVEHGGV